MNALIERYASIPPGQRYLLVALLVGGLIAGHYYFVYDDQLSHITDIEQQIGKRQAVKNEKENIAQNRATYEAKITRLQQQLDDARAKLPDTADVPQLLAQLGSHARQTGLAIDQFEPMEEAKKGFYAEIPFKMKAKGSYHELAMFIDAVGRSDRIINVTNLKMESPETLSSKVVVNATFDVKTYRFIQDTTN